MKRVWSVQYLRAAAALGVVVFHTLESSDHRFPVGAAGVDIFFIISGFIMASLMLGEEASPGVFLTRRLTRIVPLYWLATAACLAVAFVKPNFFYRIDASAQNALWSLLFIPHTSTTGGVAPVLWQGWTLEYEMFFYALCTAALFLPSRHRLKCLTLLIAMLVAIGVAFAPSGPILTAYTNTLLLEFVLGIALGAAWRVQRLPNAWTGAALLALGLTLFGLQHAALIPVSGERVIDWGVPALLIVAGALALEARGRVFRSKFGALLGDASYALYLTHGFVVSAFVWFFADATLWIRVPVCVVASVALAIATHFLVERPLAAAFKPKPQAMPERAPTQA
jgi:exopolysaccharide production protein ExoZ